MKRDNWEQRLFGKIKKTRSCWLWTGLTKQGYGYANWEGKFILVHRFFFEKLKQKIPATKVIDHICRVRNCVNPVHLRAISNRKNILIGFGRGALNARKTHCKHGHELTKPNSYSDPGTKIRRCRKCMSRRTAEWRRRCKNIWS